MYRNVTVVLLYSFTWVPKSPLLSFNGYVCVSQWSTLCTICICLHFKTLSCLFVCKLSFCVGLCFIGLLCAPSVSFYLYVNFLFFVSSQLSQSSGHFPPPFARCFFMLLFCPSLSLYLAFLAVPLSVNVYEVFG